MSNRGRVICAAILLFVFAPMLRAQIHLLRPLPETLGDMERTQLAAEHSQLIDGATSLCQRYSQYKQRCERSNPTTPPPADCAETLSQITGVLDDYNRRADTYNDAVVTKLRERDEELRKSISSDQQAIRNLGIHHDAAEFDSWTEWLKDEDKQRQKQADEAFRAAAKAAAVSTIERAIRAGVNTAATLTPQRADELVRKLEGLGVSDPLFLAAIKRFGAVTDKEQKAKAGLELLNRLKRVKGVWDLHDLGDDQESATWQAGSDLMQIFLPDPEMRLTGKLSLNLVRAVFYNVNEAWIDFPVFQSKMKSLEKLTDQHFNELKALSTRLQKHVEAKKKVAAELANIEQKTPDGGCGREVSETTGSEIAVPLGRFATAWTTN
jgi:hypothetical protein